MRTRIVIALAGAALLTGCPGSIDDPARFRNAPGACPSDYDVEEDLFRRTCAQLGCHTGGPALAAAGLDLGAPAVGARLLAHRSSECGGRPLLDAHQLDDSYLIEKLDSDTPECGDRMPAGMEPLNALERACLSEYLSALVGMGHGDAAAPPPLDAGAPAEDAGAPMPTATTVEAESMSLTGYQVDASNPTVIRVPDGATSGTASATFAGAQATYRLTVHAWAETDGQPTLTIRVGGEQVGQGTYPLATTEFEPITIGPFEVELTPGVAIELEGTVGGGAWARVDRLEIEP